ncbi:hypothetical protein FACS189456_4390 [Bacteroidia bacterium]|nr:hypothetical protein FACS189456_4390 [Bacteroidia bacterium]
MKNERVKRFVNNNKLLKFNIMEQELKSEGKCLYCGKMFAQAGINRHLKTHLYEKVKTGKSGVSYFVKVEDI